MSYPVEPPVEPMLAKLAREFPDRSDVAYEPKWDGFRCLVFRDGDDLYLQSRNAKPLLRYFPELAEPLRANLPERCVIDGELVIIGDDGALAFDALQLRQHPAESRIRRLASEIPASYVAFDIVALDDEVLFDEAATSRRARLESILEHAEAPIHLTPTTTDPQIGRDWFERFEGAGFDGVIVKPRDGRYEPGKRALVKVKHERTCDCVVAGYRVHKDGQGVGSLLLGLYDESGRLHHVGVAASLDTATRARLRDVVEPLRAEALAEHPWRDWAEFAAASQPGAADRRMPGGFSRWNADKDLSWEPIRIELVAEVAYEGLSLPSGREARPPARSAPASEVRAGRALPSGREARPPARSAPASEVRAGRALPSGREARPPARSAPASEVRAGRTQPSRFRHNARLRRLRGDRDPSSCTYSQLEVVTPAELRDLFGR